MSYKIYFILPELGQDWSQVQFEFIDVIVKSDEKLMKVSSYIEVNKVNKRV